MKLNLCSGGINKEGFINADMNPITKPDLLLDITKEKLPYEDGTVEEVHFFHGPEHIERHYWDFIFMEILRVLPPQGKLFLAYPEFITCAKEYIRFFESNDTKKDYFLQTIYGRRHWSGDEHVTAVNSSELQLILESCGYYRINCMVEESEAYYNTLMIALKDPNPQYREKIMCDEFGLGEAKSIQQIAIDKFS
jgi:predicted SAM-dependent methyltransferase